jgi:hypothetical protein
MLIAAKRHVWPLPAGAETTVTFRAIARIERIQKWAAIDQARSARAPVRGPLSRNHPAVRRRSVLRRRSFWPGPILGAQHRAPTLGRRAAYAGSVVSRMSFSWV